jgi:hypothetical protein
MDDNQLKSGVTWIQKHERVILLALILGTLLFLGNRWINYSADKTHTAATIAVQQLTEQKALNEQIRQQVQQSQTEYQQLVQLMTQENAQLAQAVSSRNTVLVKQQESDKQMPLPNLAKRWQELVPEATDMAATATGVNLGYDGALATVLQLEQVPVLQGNLKDTQTQCANTQAALNKADGLIGTLNDQVTGLNKEAVKQENACKAEIADVKAQARKSKRNWFIAGFAAGLMAKVGIKW